MASVEGADIRADAGRDGPGAGFRLGRRPALDGLRAVAVTGVMVCHAFPQFGGGGYGVDVFFCLSGFLITSLLLEEHAGGGVRLGAFWARRALRLLPALVVVLAAVTLYAPSVADPGLRSETTGAIPSVLLYWANWRRAVGHHSLGLLGPTWSLSVEEQFYVVWPLILVVTARITRRPGRWLAALAVGGMATSLVLRLVVEAGVHDPALRVLRLNGLDTRADQLLAGCLLAVVCHSLGEPARRLLGRVLGCFVVQAVGLYVWLFAHAASAGAPTKLLDTGGLTAVAVASTVVVGHVVLTPGGPLARLLALPPLRAVGRISYGLYLWHFAVFYAVASHLPTMGTAERTFCIFATSLAAATLSYLLVELPLLGLRTRLRGRPAPLPAVAATPA